MRWWLSSAAVAVVGFACRCHTSPSPHCTAVPPQAIFKKTPHDKQVMMFSATLSSDIRPVCKKFMRDVSQPPLRAAAAAAAA